MITTPLTVTLREIAAMLRVSLRAAYGLARRPTFPPALPTGRYHRRWSREVIERWIRGEWTPAPQAEGRPNA